MGSDGHVHVGRQAGIEHHHLRSIFEHGRAGNVQLLDFRHVLAQRRQITEGHKIPF
ncbi:hypothetical protein D3C87_1344330 [compost metagenome]